MEEEREVCISHLDDSGLGVAQFKEQELLVYGALPSERERVCPPRRQKKRHRSWWSTIECILESSPDRVIPRCPYVGSCGGCLLQHMAYERQLEWKNRTVLERFSPYLHAHTEMFPPLGSPEIWFYRNKMEYTFAQDSSGRRFLGLFSLLGKRRVENLSSCEIGPPWTTEALSALVTWWEKSGLSAFHPAKETGTLRTVTFRSSQRTHSMMVILTVSGRAEWAPSRKDLCSFVEVLLPLEQKYGMKLSCVIRIHQAIKGHPTHFYELVLRGSGVIKELYTVQPVPSSPPRSLELQFSPHSFCQPNTPQAEKIYTRALQMLHLNSTDVVWDLFCGVGGFGLAAAPHVKKVVCIEFSADAVYDATCNKEQAGASNLSIEKGDVFERVHSLEQEEKPTACVVDPPRSGLGEKVIHLLHSLPMEKIVYVSCNPTSQQKDMALFHSLGWSLDALQAIDQFPHTPHMENILLLQRGT